MLVGTTVFASIFTLTALSVDRYLAFKPFLKHRIVTKTKAMFTLSLIWIFSAICAFPQFLAMRTTEPVRDWPIYFCTSGLNSTTGILFRRSYGTCLIVLYIVPMLVMLFSYISIAKRIWSGPLQSNSNNLNDTSIAIGKKKITKMLFAVVLLFIICWMPYNIMSFVMDLMKTEEETGTSHRIIFHYVLLLAHVNCAANPIVYWILNKSFRHCMQNLLGCKAGILDSPSIRRKDKRVASQKFRIGQRRGRIYRPEYVRSLEILILFFFHFL